MAVSANRVFFLDRHAADRIEMRHYLVSNQVTNRASLEMAGTAGHVPRDTVESARWGVDARVSVFRARLGVLEDGLRETAGLVPTRCLAAASIRSAASSCRPCAP